MGGGAGSRRENAEGLRVPGEEQKKQTLRLEGRSLGWLGLTPCPGPALPVPAGRRGPFQQRHLGVGPGCELRQQQGACPAPTMTSERQEPFPRCHSHQPPDFLLKTVENRHRSYNRRRLPHVYTMTAHYQLF